MAWITTALRRSLWLIFIVAAGGAVWSWRRDAADASAPAPAEWPPLPAPSSAPASAAVRGTAPSWVAPLGDGTCPDGHPVKVNTNSGIFHVPGGRFYERTRAQRCYSDADAAGRDGYRRAKH